MEVLQQSGGHDRHGHQMHRVVLDSGKVVRGCPICLEAGEAEREAGRASRRELHDRRKAERDAADKG